MHEQKESIAKRHAVCERKGMLNQRSKDIAFAAIARAALPNHVVKKYIYALRPPKLTGHLHLGCGTHYLAGFVNIDANPFQKTDLWLDVRNGLPFPSGFLDSIYSTHMFEHFYASELQKLLSECWRVLKPGGGVRLIVPSLASAVKAYAEGQVEWFEKSFPNPFDSIGGRFSNFMFCDGQHRTAFDFSYLEEVLRSAGFREVFESGEGQSQIYRSQVPPYQPNDSLQLPHSLYVEGFK